MTSVANRASACALAAVCAAAILTLTTARGAAAPPACDPDNGGLKLPQGFCALVVATDLGAARHLAVAANGDLYVSLMTGRGQTPGVVALRDTNGDGKMDVTERFGDKSSTGIALRNGYLYVATVTSVERYKMTKGELRPSGAAEVIAADLPLGRPHQDKGIAFDGKGSLYVNFGAPSNACQPQDRRAEVPGQDPCPAPIASFPPHSAPVDLMFYTGTQFPKRYQGGAFIAFHGSWNRSPMPQDGYNVTFQPFAAGKPSGKGEIFADGFAGPAPIKQQNDAAARADGVAQAPDGSLYIAESVKGKIWRVIYTGK